MENRAEIKLHQPKTRMWLKLLRVERGLTQKQTAHACGLQQSMYSYIENGRMFPDENDAKKIAEFFNCDYMRFYQ